MALAFKRAFRCARAFSRRLFATPSTALCEIALCLALCSLRAAFWRRQIYSGPSRLGQTNGDRLLWRSGAVLAFPDVFHFFAHKLARLSAGRFAFALILARSFNCFFIWHNKMVSPLATRLDVKKRRELPSTACLFKRTRLIVRLAARGRGFAWFVWIVFCVYDTFLIKLGV